MHKHRHYQSQPFKWLFAFIVFVALMCFTMADVYGAHLGGNSSADNKSADFESNGPDRDGSCGDKSPVNNSAAPVPEPMTLILVAGGLTALYAARKVRSKNY